MPSSSLKHTAERRSLQEQDSPQVEARLIERMGEVHARQRLGIESDHLRSVFSGMTMFSNRRHWYSLHSLLRAGLRCAGLYRRGQRNATRLQQCQNRLELPSLPSAFEGFRILHLSDLHLDMYSEATGVLIEKLHGVEYDLCVMTGDYRALTFGSIDSTMSYLEAVRAQLKGPIYAVLGNHDSIRMVPPMEDMGIKMLLNEGVSIERGDSSFYLAGIDDAHFFHVDNIEKSLDGARKDQLRILLSHTPEVYRQAAHAGFHGFMCGHTHGGQICLPGGTPLTLDIDCPSHLGKGAWRYHQMRGYTSCGSGTSIVDARFNCPPEITLHTLQRAADD